MKAVVTKTDGGPKWSPHTCDMWQKPSQHELCDDLALKLQRRQLEGSSFEEPAHADVSGSVCEADKYLRHLPFCAGRTCLFDENPARRYHEL